MDYKCKSCEKNVSGFHDCTKITYEKTEECGCQILIKEGFEDIYAVQQSIMEYIYPCAFHKKRLEKANKINPDMSYKEMLENVLTKKM